MKDIELTEKLIREKLLEMFKEDESSRKVVLYTGGYMDEDGNIHCKFLEQLDRMIRKEVAQRYSSCGQAYEKQNNENEDLSQL